MQKSFTTRSLNIPFPKDDPHRALDMPVYESVAFDFASAEDIAANFRGELPAHVYSRTSNPTVEYFERKMKTLTGAHQALALASGMAAISNTILALCKAGDNIISGNHLFGHTYSLFNQSFANYGLETRFVDTTDPDAVEALIDEKTRLIYFETVTNPQLEIADIEALAAIATKHHILLVADSTVTPPVVFNSKNLGVHIEVMSTTKFISGGATSFGGVILDNGLYDWSLNPNLTQQVEKFGKDAFIARLRKNYYRNTGGSMTAHTAHFQIMGLDMLELRLERCFENCLALGGFLEKHPKVKKVTYPGLKTSADFNLAEKQFSGKPGTIMTFDLESQKACFAFMNQLQIIRRATNLNDNKSLIIHPYSTIYVEFSEEERNEMGIRDTMLRLSVGIEAAADLIADIEQALGQVGR
ncbi:aminotransferase class I/II-fold pyridoxal phosphate-dependent enzyme [Gaoshiqia sediminis]|uniref:Aminotransferase class I/II-fold pyridoxal phosphate-dependent enzyme n=1 Tax=Gaoshiqia sediminis TaxID=2986998 RepID=A0AA41Y7Q2_9BACT|nr:aminotransferase class I/II-fold pyridoxal phosphate-dependent enzyme [Gaoshiqia sediminis]MCW0484934.1 aminotransferase class I/II-fold pyridoxal phosphate-dependent enzyme [Gaoshiqia sediminis]